ncbi:hypothetical protein JYT16_02325 [Gemmatimonas aurantiaca]|nr:hypothetical protein [Gemmatimonas aurantiaca]
MNHQKIINTPLILLTCFFMLLGCKPKWGAISTEEIKKIKTVVIVTEIIEEGVQIIDHTGSSNTAAATHLGIIGALLNQGVISHTIRKSLGGSFDILRTATSNFGGREFIDTRIAELFVSDFQTIMIGQPDMSLVTVSRRNKKGQRIKTRDYSRLVEPYNADIILEINYVYGVATYSTIASCSAVIRAYVKVIRVSDGELLLRKVLSSDAVYRHGYVIDDLADEDGEVYKRELENATIAFTHILVKEFGETTTLPIGKYWNNWTAYEKK